ncbi:phosphonate metabolism transcriptional regulator PhnF [Pseudochelatococcus sp. B33]
MNTNLPPEKASLAERRGSTSLWRLIVETLTKDIITGKYVPGDRLPTEQELAVTFNVHRNTIRRALQVLRDQDRIRIEQGRGSFVRERVVRHPLGLKTRLISTLQDVERTGERRFLYAQRVRADKSIASDLKIQRNQFVRKVERLSLADGVPVSVSSNYFPLPRFKGIEKYIEESNSFTEAWRHYGIEDYSRFETRITAIPLSSADADILLQPRRRPAILMVNINVDADGIPIVVSHTRVSPQHMELIVRY